MITTKDVMSCIPNAFKLGQHTVIPNVNWGGHESDMLIITKSNYMYEIEIKISVPDFRKDKDKRKWQWIDPETGFYSSKIKYFYYAMPDYIYEKVKGEVPEFAGVLIVRLINTGGELAIIQVKEPAKIKKHRKLTDKEVLQLHRLCMFRYWNLFIRQKVS